MSKQLEWEWEWKWVLANGLIHIHCDDILEIAQAIIEDAEAES
jgi:hypothetical protein